MGHKIDLRATIEYPDFTGVADHKLKRRFAFHQLLCVGTIIPRKHHATAGLADLGP